MNTRILSLVILAATGIATRAGATTWTVGSGCGATLQACVDYAYAHNAQGTEAQINIPSGTTWAGAAISGPISGSGGNLGKGYLTISGSGSTSTTVKEAKGMCGVFVVTNGANVILQNMTITSSASCVSGIFAQNSAVTQIGPDFVFGTVTVQHMHAEAHSIIEIGQTRGSTGYHVKGGAQNHWGCSTGGYIELDPVTLSITFDHALSFSQSFAWGQSGCQILVGEPYVTFVNTSNVSSPYRYIMKSNSVLEMNGGTRSLPGTSAFTETGGVCVDGGC